VHLFGRNVAITGRPINCIFVKVSLTFTGVTDEAKSNPRHFSHLLKER